MSTLVKKRLTGKKIGRGTRNLLTVLFAVAYLIPLYVAVVNSFKTYWEVIKSPLALPSSPTLENFTEAFHASNILSLYGTSILITFTSVTLLVLISSTAASKVSPIRFRSLHEITVPSLSTTPRLRPTASFICRARF